jgi:hypothetical protein
VLADFEQAPKDLPPQEVKAQWRSIDSVAEEVQALGRRCLKIWCDLANSKPDEARAKGMSLREFRAGIVAEAGKSVPLGRVAEPEDVANPGGRLGVASYRPHFAATLSLSSCGNAFTTGNSSSQE